MPFSPLPGLNSDDTTFAAEGRWADAGGFRFVQGKPQTIERHVALVGANVQACTKMLAYKVSGSPALATAGGALKRHALPAGTETVITPASGWTGTQFCLQMWGDILIALCSGGKLFESSAGAQATAVTNAPDTSTAMVVTPSRQIMLLGTKEEASGTFNGRCIRWSDIEDRNSWTTTATNNAGEYILPGQSDIVGGTVLGDYILIWTESAMFLAQFIGDPSQTFTFTRIEGDCGLLGLNAFTILDGVVYWIARALSFHAYQVGGMVTQIPCPISLAFNEIADASTPSKAFACTVRRHKEVWFGYVTPGAIAGPSLYLIYCVGESIAAQAPVWSRGAWTGLLPSQSAAGAMIDTQTFAPTSAAGPIVAAYDASGAVPVLFARSGSEGPEAAYIQSADQYIDQSQRRMMIRRFIPDFEYQGGAVSLALSSRDRPHSSASTLTVSVATSDTKKDFRKSGKIMSAKFTAAANTRLRLGKPLFDIVPLGER